MPRRPSINVDSNAPSCFASIFAETLAKVTKFLKTNITIKPNKTPAKVIGRDIVIDIAEKRPTWIKPANTSPVALKTLHAL